MTKHVHPQNDLIDEFEPSAMSIMPDADGIPGLPPTPRHAPAGPPPPRLCELGPCANYHTFKTEEASQGPIDGSRGLVHIRVAHYCYPTAGVEMNMGDVPVFDCNRWAPPGGASKTMKSRDGGNFIAAIGAWQAYRAEVAKEFDAAVADTIAEITPTTEGAAT